MRNNVVVSGGYTKCNPVAKSRDLTCKGHKLTREITK